MCDMIFLCHQEDLLEKQPVMVWSDGMELEIDDTNEINEDTILVTGFTVRYIEDIVRSITWHSFVVILQQG